MEHEHHHHEECGCGHDHSHEHAHEAACTCGHEHHEHHEHDHGHDHEHEHDREAPRPAPKTKAEQRVYILENLDCPNCAAKIEGKIAALPEVEYAGVTFATKQLRVAAAHQDALLPKLVEIVHSLEPEVQVVPYRRPAAGRQSDQEEKKNRIRSISLIAVTAVALIAGVLMHHYAVIGSSLYLTIMLCAYVACGGEVVWEAVKNILRGQIFDENFLMSVATIGAFFVGEYPEAVGVMLFYRVGELFEQIATERSRNQIMDAVDLRPEVVHRLRGEDVETLPAEDAQVGDLLLVRPGDRVPLDGTVIEGESYLDTSAITGEPVPVRVVPGSTAVSGCVNQSGVLKLRVEKPLEESMVTRILDAVENAAASKPQIDRFITRFCKYYTPAVCALALLTAVVPPLFFSGDWSHWVYTALTFLVISCPCALVLSVPLAFFCGIGNGSRSGILFKGGAALEALCKIKAVAMDKTGTITQGNFAVQQCIPAGSLSEGELLVLAAACEQNSTHPIAQSIVSAADAWDLPLPTLSWTEEQAGAGIIARLDGKDVLCGNRRLMEAHGVDLSAAPAQTGTEVLLAQNGTYLGVIIIDDRVKPDAQTAVTALRAMGVATAMLTGDGKESADAVAGRVGIDEVHAKLLPEQKFEVLGDIRARRGSVMFVGDGINDAPVLAGADVGAAMGTGADAAIEAADVVFMTGEVAAVPAAISIARATNRIARENVAIALIIKFAIMALGLLNHANMWTAVFADTGVSILCILNSIRILYQNHGK